LERARQFDSQMENIRDQQLRQFGLDTRVLDERVNDRVEGARQFDAELAFRREQAGVSEELDRARLGLEEQRVGHEGRRVDIADRDSRAALASRFQDAVTSTDPQAYRAWIEAGGGSLWNSMSSGTDALSDRVLAPAAAMLAEARPDLASAGPNSQLQEWQQNMAQDPAFAAMDQVRQQHGPRQEGNDVSRLNSGSRWRRGGYRPPAGTSNNTPQNTGAAPPQKPPEPPQPFPRFGSAGSATGPTSFGALTGRNPGFSPTPPGAQSQFGAPMQSPNPTPGSPPPGGGGGGSAPISPGGPPDSSPGFPTPNPPPTFGPRPGLPPGISQPWSQPHSGGTASGWRWWRQRPDFPRRPSGLVSWIPDA
jgi:hypothetical protein